MDMFYVKLDMKSSCKINPNLTISYPVLYKAVSLYDWSLFNIWKVLFSSNISVYKRKVELCQSQQYVPLSSFVFSIEYPLIIGVLYVKLNVFR